LAGPRLRVPVSRRPGGRGGGGPPGAQDARSGARGVDLPAGGGMWVLDPDFYAAARRADPGAREGQGKVGPAPHGRGRPGRRLASGGEPPSRATRHTKRAAWGNVARGRPPKTARADLSTMGRFRTCPSGAFSVMVLRGAQARECVGTNRGASRASTGRVALGPVAPAPFSRGLT
jgi:hypothetical protein